jgi:hypothetical protein
MVHYNRVRAHGNPHTVKKSGQPTKPPIENSWNNVTKLSPEECWEWEGSRAPNGYGSFHMGGRTVMAHRAAYTLIVGEIPEGLHILHACDNPPCVNPHHLSVGTRSDNMQDMVAKGRNRVADDHPTARLSSAQVREIRRRRAAGETVTDLAASYMIGLATASRAINGVYYKRLKPATTTEGSNQ